MIDLIKAKLYRFACLLVAAFSFGAEAQEWPPERPVRLIVAALPGSSPDVTARLLANELHKQTGRTFVVINKAGGLGIPALTEVSQAAPDGTTLLVGNINTNGLAPALHGSKYAFDIKSALQPITPLSEGPSALIASPATPAGGFRDQVAAWRSNPGKYAYFAAGPGSFGHIWFAKLIEQQSLDLLFVPVKGGVEGLQLMHEGSVHYSYVPITSFIGQMRNKEVRALFVTSPARLAEFPDVPTLREVGLSEDFGINTWVGLFAPPAMSADLLKRIHSAFSKAISQPEIAARYKESYMLQKLSPSPEDFKKFVDGQIDAYRQIAARAHIKVD